MSFILDALTRSERERQTRTVPSVHTVHFPPAVEPASGDLSRVLTLGGVTLAVGAVLAWWLWRDTGVALPLRDGGAYDRPVAAAQPSPDTLASIEPSIVRDPPPAVVETTEISEPPAVRRPTPALTAPSQPVLLDPADEEAGWKLITPQTLDEKTAAAGPTSDRVDSGQPLYSVEDLPLVVRSELPDVVFSGHLYSGDPAARMIIIDGSRTMGEGQQVAAELYLEEITRDGVIMVFRGYRFSAGVVGNWALR